MTTTQQNKSLHLWLRMLADDLNGAGFSVGDGVLIKLPILYTEENLKADVLRPLMKALYPDLTSTRQLDTKQTQELYRYIDHVVSERTGVHVEFPSEEAMMMQQYDVMER